ncbi:hypothetical protein [Piscinibacter sp.]|uniref:hypothetical protein n=1 Tax=Piscinibacter sp. TaxID=1903157 RepID=UPI0039E35062
MSSSLRLIVSVSLSLATTFSAANAQCDDEPSARKSVEGIEKDLVQLRDQQEAREEAMQRRIKEVADGLVRSGKWVEQDRAIFFEAQIRTEAYVAAEKKKKSDLDLLALAAQSVIGHQEKGDFKMACLSAADMRLILERVGATNDAQYTRMLEGIRTIAERK